MPDYTNNENMIAIERQYIDELDLLSKEYQPFGGKGIFLFTVFLLIGIFALGFLIGFSLAIPAMVAVVITYKKLYPSTPSSKLSKEKLAYRLCVVMQALIDIKRGNYVTDDGIYVANINAGSHKHLYFEFISLYPRLGTWKLMMLALVEIEPEDIAQ